MWCFIFRTKSNDSTSTPKYIRVWLSGVTQRTSTLRPDGSLLVTTSMSTLLCVPSTSQQPSLILMWRVVYFLRLWLQSSVTQYRDVFFKHGGLYFNYQYSRGALWFSPSVQWFPVLWQPIALTAAINWFCYMLLWRFRSIIGGEI